MSIDSIAEAIGTSRMTAVIVDNFWIVPTVQSIHIIAIAFVLTGSVVITGRAWGVIGMEWTAARWGQRLLPGMWAALAVLLVTGILMIIGEPTRELPNASFQVKMVAVIVAVLLNVVLARRILAADGAAVATGTRALALLLMLIWLFIIAAGRWIAYV